MNDGFGAVAKLDLAAEADFRLGDLLVRPSTCRVIGGRGEVRVEPRVMEVLITLWRANGGTVTREQLIQCCWGGRAISDDAITRVIAKVRQLANGADDRPHFLLETLPKVGYRLTDPTPPAAIVHSRAQSAPPTISKAAQTIEQEGSSGTRGTRSWTEKLSKNRLLAYAVFATLALIVIALGVQWRQAQRNASSNAEAVRLTEAARALIHERNRQSVAEAEHLLREAVAVDPSYAAAWARLGHATWFPWWTAEQNEPGAKLKVKAEALAYARRALTISPGSAEAQGIMGMVLTDTNDGMPWLESAVRTDPNSAELWMWLGDGRRLQGDLRGALIAYEKARSLDPAWHYSDEPYVDMVFRLRGPEEAYRELDRMAVSMNDQSWFQQERSDLKYSEGRLADSAALAAAELRAHPQNPYWARSRLVSIASLLAMASLQDRLLAKDPLLQPNFNAFHKPGWAYHRAQTSADTWWDATLLGAQAAQLVSEHRSALLLSLYDRRFKSPEDFISKCPSFCNPISAGPALVVALRQMGRNADANRMLVGLRKAVSQLEAAGDRLFATEVSGARIAALAGNAKEANRRLRDATLRGWKGQDTGFPDPELDPAFADLQRDPEFRSIMKLLRTSQQAEAKHLATVDLSGLD